MWSVDKWLEGDELKQHEVNRAITMREKTLQITEELQAEIEMLKKNLNDVSKCNINLMYRMDKAKSEAYKDLTDKLYEKIEQNSQFSFDYVTKKEIENIARELEEK